MGVINITIVISKIVMDFFVLDFSLAVIDAVYMNRVIIPDENVRIRTMDIHLLVTILYINMDLANEITKIIIDMCIGFFIFMVFVVIINRILDVFLFFFWFTKSMFYITSRNIF